MPSTSIKCPKMVASTLALVVAPYAHSLLTTFNAHPLCFLLHEYQTRGTIENEIESLRNRQGYTCTTRLHPQGHSSFVTHLDWSEDSQFLQSNSGDYEILFCMSSIFTLSPHCSSPHPSPSFFLTSPFTSS